MSESATESDFSEAESDHSSSESSDSDYEPDWIECNCSRVGLDGLCKCKKEPAWELDSAGEILSSAGTININVSLPVTKFHAAIRSIPYFKSGKHLELGDIVPMYSRGGTSDNIVSGWTKDDFITLPTLPVNTGAKNNKYCAGERFFDSGDLEEIKGRVDLQPLFKQLADAIREQFQ
jgi:hypothetical protein